MWCEAGCILSGVKQMLGLWSVLEIAFENYVDAQVSVENPGTEQVGAAVTCLTCIRKVPSSRPDRYTDHIYWGFSWFSSVPQANSGKAP
jgi:hypothetical protein